MFRTAATPAVTALALLAASAGAAHAGIGDFAQAQADPVAMEAEINSQLAGRVFGYQYAIKQDGKLAVADAKGTALSAKDAGGAAVPMTSSTRMDIASATKTFTSISTLKLLKANGLTIESKVAPYLPSGWARGLGFGLRSTSSWLTSKDDDAVRFRHLLNHTSGVYQAVVKAIDSKQNEPAGNGWDGVQDVVQNGTIVDSDRKYHNYNFTVLRVLNAELYKRAAKKPAVTQANHAAYGLDAMRSSIFNPAGMENVTCTHPNPATAMKSYGLGATQQSKGTLHASGPETCAGHRGLVLSTIDHVQMLASLRSGDILEDDDLDTMDKLTIGWDERSGTGEWNGVYFHAGDLSGTHTCGATMDDGTQVSLMVNSEVVATAKPGGMNTVCGVVLSAYRAATD